MSKNDDDFTSAEMAELFGEPPKSGRRRKATLPKRLNKQALAKADEPFLSDPNDRAFIKPKQPKINYDPKRNSVKVLTILKPKRIIPVTIKRKDGKMATKAKIKIDYTQRTAVCLLAGGALLGFADQLGGGLKACGVAALLVACLFVLAVDFDK